MKELEADVKSMVEAAKQSTKLKLNAEETAVTRVDPLPTPEDDTYNQRCIHVVRVQTRPNNFLLPGFNPQCFLFFRIFSAVSRLMMLSQQSPASPSSSLSGPQLPLCVCAASAKRS